MAGIADYLNRTITDDADPGALLLQAAQLLHQAGAIYDDQRRAAELAQMSATDPDEQTNLEYIIQQTGGIGRDINEYCRRMRKHGLQSAATIVKADGALAVKFADEVTTGITVKS